MADNGDYLRKVAALLGSTGVALGAIGAHAMKETLAKRNTLASYQTATLYQLFHATAILALSSTVSSIGSTAGGQDGAGKANNNYLTTAGNLMGIGTLMFSGSIYCLSLGIGPKALLGPTTPLGGLLMIGGWIVVGVGSGKNE